MKRNMRQCKKSSDGTRIAKHQAVILLAVGLVLGTVFTFGVKYWNKGISVNETIKVTGTYQSYHIRSGYEGLVREKSGKEITVCFSDIENKFVDSSCNTDALREKLRSVTPGTKVEMLIHPNSPTIMEMRADGTEILSFEDASRAMASSSAGFMLLGLFLYAMAVYGGYLLLSGKCDK
ncbi:MAG: hypothetical protein IJR90_02470 [Clostridia bacterium]|nr:hypothetical protein [Clostridia bacterium]